MLILFSMLYVVPMDFSNAALPMLVLAIATCGDAVKSRLASIDPCMLQQYLWHIAGGLMYGSCTTALAA